jgi:hypothetical protein
MKNIKAEPMPLNVPKRSLNGIPKVMSFYLNLITLTLTTYMKGSYWYD